MTDFQERYTNLEHTPIYLTRPLGLIEISGTSRLDLLDRMSTQKLKGLQPHTGAATILTTDIGRIIDRILIYADNDRLLAVTGENNGENIIRYLMRYVFFNDDFQMRDLSSSHTAITVYGKTGASLLSKLTGIDVTQLPQHHWCTAEIGKLALTIHRTDPIGGDGFLLILPRDQQAELETMLNTAGVQSVSPETFAYCRVAAGQPKLGFELTNDYIPLETGLWDDVSFNKGCYVGQEIIARMESRGKIAKKMVRLTANGPLSRGADITADGRKVGTITSTLAGLALGYVKTTTLDKDLTLTADGQTLTLQTE